MKGKGNPHPSHRFKSGTEWDGNPGGAPKGKRISTWMLELGNMIDLPDGKTLPANGQIALARILKAREADGERSTEIILDRTEGKVDQEITVKTPYDLLWESKKHKAIGTNLEQ